MSKRYELRSTITISASESDTTTLRAILEDEEKRIGSRATYAITGSDATSISLEVHATDATALKTAMSAISSIMRTAEKMNKIGE